MGFDVRLEEGMGVWSLGSGEEGWDFGIGGGRLGGIFCEKKKEGEGGWIRIKM